jgi:hypothetical protein
MSKAVPIVLGGLAVLFFSHHGAVHRDRYASRADCERDWPRHAGDCQAAGGGAYAGFQGPSYEAGHRPSTPHPELRSGTDQVRRSGFGRSGARFGGGS